MQIEVIDTTTGLNNVFAKSEIHCYLEYGNLRVSIPNQGNSPYNLSVATIDGKVIHSGKYNSHSLLLQGLGLEKNRIYIVTIADNNTKKNFKLINK